MLDDGEILNSEAALFAARSAAWRDETRETLRLICDRIAGQARARMMRELKFILPLTEALHDEIAGKFGAVAPFGLAHTPSILHVPHSAMFALIAYLQQRGAQHLSVEALDYIFASDNPLWRAVADKL